MNDLDFLVSNSIYAERTICYRPSVCLSVCQFGRLWHGWGQKRLTLGSCNFHHRVAQSL